jgi:hypothetical protein
MILNEHSELRGKHAFLSPSRSGWERYDPDKLIQSYIASFATEMGTAVHEFAANCISERIKLKKNDKTALQYHLSVYKKLPRYSYDLDFIYPTVMAYVNDGIGFRMQPEVIFQYSEYSFGTADTFSFNEKNKFLRIHDLKTGRTPAKMEQLIKYAALFALEYNINPIDIQTELRIYQANEAVIYIPQPEEVRDMMTVIVDNDAILERFTMRGQ